MNFNELSKSRKSVRSFQDKVISKDDLMTLIEAAQSAPSAGNCQPWHFFVVTDNATKEKLTNECCYQSFIMTAPAIIVICADIPRTTGRYGDRGRDLYCLQDTAAAIQNILLCAKSMDMGTCWVGAFDEQKTTEVLNLQPDMRPIAVIPVGYPANDTPFVKRRPIEEIVTFVE